MTAASLRRVGIGGRGTYAPVSTGSAPRSRTRRTASPSKVVTTFQTGHGFVSGNADATTNLNDTTRPMFGPQSVKLVSKGDGTATTLGKNAVSAVDLTTNYARICLSPAATNDVLHASRVELYLGSGGSVANRYVITNICKAEVTPAVNFVKGGETVEIDLSLADATTVLAPNPAAIDSWQLRLVDDATGKITFYAGEIAVVPKSTTLPYCMVWTFDDSQASFALAEATLGGNGHRASFFHIFDQIDNVAGGYMSSAYLDKLYAQGHDHHAHAIDLAEHSLTNGIIDKSPADRLISLRAQKDWLISRGYTRGADIYATPQGKFDAALIPTLRSMFSAHRTTVDLHKETSPPADPYRLRVMQLPAPGSDVTTAAQVTTAMDAVKANGGLLILMGHHIVASGAATTLECNLADVQTIDNYAVTIGMPVKTLTEALALV